MRRRSGSSQGVAALRNHPPAGAVDHDAATPCRGAGLARPAHRDCSVRAGIDNLMAISAGMLQPTELSGYQSASPDSSGQEQGGVSARLRPATSCAGQRRPRL